MSAPAPPLAPDLATGLKRLKLATIRAQAPEVLQVAKTQRWAPEELLRALIEAELAARDRANRAARLKAAGFPAAKALDDFDVAASSVPRPTFEYLAALEWVRAPENCLVVGQAHERGLLSDEYFTLDGSPIEAASFESLCPRGGGPSDPPPGSPGNPTADSPGERRSKLLAAAANADLRCRRCGALTGSGANERTRLVVPEHTGHRLRTAIYHVPERHRASRAAERLGIELQEARLSQGLYVA